MLTFEDMAIYRRLEEQCGSENTFSLRSDEGEEQTTRTSISLAEFVDENSAYVRNPITGLRGRVRKQITDIQLKTLEAGETLGAES